jgi:hypothetical protein
MLRVRPDAKSLPVARVEIYYSTDPDPRARFWRSAEVHHESEGYITRLPIHTHDLPLFAFANVYHTLPKPESLAQIPGNAKPVTELCLSSLFHSHSADEIKQANPKLTAKPSTLIDDFTHGTRDWYALNAGNATHQQLWTRKLTDPLWRGPEGSKLHITLKLPQTNRLSIVLQQNEWRSYRGQRRTFVCTREIPASEADQTLTLDLKDFASSDGSPASWAEMDQLGICASFGIPANEVPLWNGPAPEFKSVEWK